jgi:putative PIN family toxin of toxin-antitoxin system
MMPGHAERVVFDCTVFAQALISPTGPAGACISHAQNRKLTLFVSAYVIQEIRELPSKIKRKLGVTDEKVERLIHDLAHYAKFIKDIPAVYDNPFDAEDSHYVDLAVASGSALVVSRDRHLLNLMDEARGEAKDFKTRFPGLIVITPDALTEQIRNAREV